MSKKTYEVLKDFKGSPDGHTVIHYLKGQDEVELDDDLAKVALEEKWVKVSKTAEKRAKEEADAKAKADAAENAKADAIAALEADLAKLKADFDAATADDAKAKIVAEADAKQAELDKLLA